MSGSKTILICTRSGHQNAVFKYGRANIQKNIVTKMQNRILNLNSKSITDTVMTAHKGWMGALLKL